MNYDKFIKFCTYYNHNLFILNENNLPILNNLIIQKHSMTNTQDKINKQMKKYKEKETSFSNNLRMTFI